MMIPIAVLTAFVVLWTTVRILKYAFDRPIIERFGYVEGAPKKVKCNCGTPCRQLRTLYYQKENGAMYTEWICTECHPDWTSYL